MEKKKNRERLSEEDVEALAKDSANALSFFFQGNDDDEASFVRARLAASTFSSCAKWKQTNGARDMMHWGMARDLAAGDTKELQRLISKALPDSPLAKTENEEEEKEEKLRIA